MRGKALTENSDDWEDSYLVDSFQKDNPTIRVYKELEKAAESNPFIKTYLETIRKHKFEVYKGKRQKHNYQFAKEQIENLKNFRIRSADLSKKEIKQLANDFLRETNRLKQEKYLRFFSTIKFPFDYQPILKIAKGKNSKDDRLVEFACEALSYFTANDIREFAVRKLSKTKKPEDYLYLLVSNYKEGDYELLKSIAGKHKSFEMIHSLVWGYVAIYKANSTKECQEPLEAIYDKLNCGLHRQDIVKILITNEVLSDKISEEIKFDSYDVIRELYTENFGTVQN